MMPVVLDFVPRLMPAPQAAHYLGVSVSMLHTLSISRKKLGAKRLYDRIDLDGYADSLTGEFENEVNTCDVAFFKGAGR